MSPSCSSGLKVTLFLGILFLVTNCTRYQPPGGDLYKMIQYVDQQEKNNNKVR